MATNASTNSESNKANAANPNIDIGNPYTPRRPSPIISISVNHPIAQAVRKIKNFLVHKQTLFSTTFSIKVTPIVAIVSLFGLATLFGGGITTAYNFGKTVEQKFLITSPSAMPKATPIAAVPVTVSRSGTIKATYQLPVVNANGIPVTPSPTSNVILNDSEARYHTVPGEGSQSINSSTSSQIPPTPGTIRSPASPTTQPAILHYILISRSGSITYLSSLPVHLQNYLNLRVLITGSYNPATNILTIVKPDDIEVLN